MASVKDTGSFFIHGNSKQFDYVLKLYPQVLKLKAEARNKKPAELIRLDDWFQNELPKKIKQRGKDAYLVHEELVQAMKWKQARGKFYPQLSYLIKVNTPRAVMQETKKAFRKLPNLEQALTALSNLKGVGTTMASALLAAAAPDSAPFMADECLMAIPDIEGIDYTTKEYLNYVQHIQSTVTRLNSEKDINGTVWSPHSVELAVWTHSVATQLQPELLDGLPLSLTTSTTTEIEITTPADPTDNLKTTRTNNDNDNDNNTADESSSDLLTNENTKSNASEADSDENNKIPSNNINNSSNNCNSNDSSNSNTSSSITNTIAGETQATFNIPTLNGNNIPLLVAEQSDESNLDQPVQVIAANGNNKNGESVNLTDDNSRSDDNSLEKPVTPIVANDEINDSDSQASSIKRSLDCDSSESQTTADTSEPETKKCKIAE